MQRKLKGPGPGAFATEWDSVPAEVNAKILINVNTAMISPNNFIIILQASNSEKGPYAGAAAPLVNYSHQNCLIILIIAFTKLCIETMLLCFLEYWFREAVLLTRRWNKIGVHRDISALDELWSQNTHSPDRASLCIEMIYLWQTLIKNNTQALARKSGRYQITL